MNTQCIRCDQHLENTFDGPWQDYGVWGGLVFAGTGSFGSAKYDTLKPDFTTGQYTIPEIAICDECMEKLKEKGLLIEKKVAP